MSPVHTDDDDVGDGGGGDSGVKQTFQTSPSYKHTFPFNVRITIA